MLTVIFDRNFKDGVEKNFRWKVGDPLPEMAPHRIIEMHATKEEAKHIDLIMSDMSNRRNEVHIYGDLARTVWINLEAEEYENDD